MTRLKRIATDTIASAETHLPHAIQPTSAEFCLREAQDLMQIGAHLTAASWALRSLKYSVGIFHPDYRNFDK
jgi:hypothetical protein